MRRKARIDHRAVPRHRLICVVPRRPLDLYELWSRPISKAAKAQRKAASASRARCKNEGARATVLGSLRPLAWQIGMG